ncbi:VOC family protein [Oceaniovalibus sp. ACAM 378]|uniref:VOC family protein n=1 Tax=Oceaniovalibus sp. ACAM 378 TaxID=2599923 RepID=UPI0011D9E63B|nr:VOC family protein [Oceaniovalibus sp. ACAM 378]TYB86060.1 VOC family protein [Oceaniovalibus sp. ACAM 378]
MNVRQVFETVNLFSDKFAACRDFYHSALGLTLVFDDNVSAVFEFGGIMVNILALSEADELVSPQIARGNTAGVSTLFTLLVDDCDLYCQMLAKRGVTLLNGPTDRPWGRRTAAFADPSGHVWEVAQKLAA